MKVKLQPLSRYLKKNLWLAVVPKKNTFLVAAADKDSAKALSKGRELVQQVFLMRSSVNYGLWAPSGK